MAWEKKVVHDSAVYYLSRALGDFHKAEKNFENEKRHHWWMIWFTHLTGVIVIFILCIILAFFILRQRLAEQKRLLAEKETMLKNRELENANTEQKLKEAEMIQLGMELQIREQDLISKSLVQAELIQVNQSVNEKLLPFKLKISKKKDQEDFLQALHEIVRDVNKDPLTDFNRTFEQLHHEFFNNLLLRYPSLTGSELNIAAMVRLNLSTKEIARLGNISPSTVEASRFRLRKKLELETKQNLTSFLIAFH
jgi:AraC family transcriptional regulator, chitin signaling transcriptional activator